MCIFFLYLRAVNLSLVHNKMKCTIPEISWHNRDPVLSIDIQPKVDDKNEFYRLATGGTDSHVLVRENRLSLHFVYKKKKKKFFVILSTKWSV